MTGWLLMWHLCLRRDLDPTLQTIISIAAICCKIMEHVLCHYIMNHLEQHNILQYGFRPGHSCQAQLISLVEEIQQALDHHHQVDLVMLRSLIQSWVLKKLNFYSIKGLILNWVETWLTQRSQWVVVNGNHSEFLHVESGFPQGTVL